MSSAAQYPRQRKRSLAGLPLEPIDQLREVLGGDCASACEQLRPAGEQRHRLKVADHIVLNGKNRRARYVAGQIAKAEHVTVGSRTSNTSNGNRAACACNILNND